MKLKYITVLLFLIFSVTTSLSASTYSDYLPEGKNYLEFDNFTLRNQVLSTNDSILVKSNTTYTISFPGEGLIERPEINIGSSDTLYIDGLATLYNECAVSMEYTICTFTTNNTTTYLDITINADGLDLYYNHYQMDQFQLEEGPIKTAYEEYIHPFVDASSPEFNGSGAYVTSYANNYSLNYIISEHIVVVDDIDGDITNRVEVLHDEYSSNIDTVGEYQVDLMATDEAGNSAYFTLTIIVKDEISPVLNGPDTLVVSMDTTQTIMQLINENYQAIDGHDGEIEIALISDDYSSNKSLIGSYYVSFFVIDTSGNQTIKDITINVVDNTAPTLISNNQINVVHSNYKTIDEILEMLVFTDNHDDSSSITLSILSDSYTPAEQKPGAYNVNLLITDTAGNNNVLDITVILTDDIYPTITGPSEYSYSYTEQHTIDDIISLLEVHDNYDILQVSDLTIINDTFSNRTSSVGIYTITFEITDSSLNKTTHQIDITIIDDQPPVIYVDNVFITLGENTTFNEQDALNVMIKNQELPESDYQIEVMKDEYTGNENIPGTYLYRLKFIDNDGMSLSKDFLIEVPETENTINGDYLIRNIIVYTVSISFLIFVIIKNKK